MEGYRKNVAMVVMNDNRQVLICRRKGTENWQFPQGGIDNNELLEEAMYRELYEEVYRQIGVPIVFDYHHHKFCDGGLREQDALALALSTWGETKPVVHYSQSRCEEHNDNKIRENAHSDSYWTPIELYNLDLDVMLECKHKEFGLFKMQELMSE